MEMIGGSRRCAVALVLLSTAATVARADIPPPGRAECLDRYEGEPCGPDAPDGGAQGVCRKIKCWKDTNARYGEEMHPVEFDCVRCTPRDWKLPAPNDGAGVRVVEEAPDGGPRRRYLLDVQRDDDEPWRSRALAERVRREAAAREEAARAARKRRLGIGLGVGSPIVILIVALAARRRRQRK